MRRDQLEHAIRTACQIIEQRAVVVVGSQAILGTFTFFSTTTAPFDELTLDDVQRYTQPVSYGITSYELKQWMSAAFIQDGFRVRNDLTLDLGLRYEGRARPFYFDGLLTVEAKLFHLVRPDVAVYGDRDRQRVFLVRRMIRDLFFDIDVATVQTVRGDDGLPVSTRVGMLEDRDLAAAAMLPVALDAAAANADRGVDACIAAAQSTLMGEPRIRLEYLSVVDPATFLPVDEGSGGPALALIAATVAGHRFIDNAEIYLG